MVVWGDVAIEVDDCTFQKNRAVTEGGAVKVQNFASAQFGLAYFQMNNSRVLGNEAGTNLFEDRLYGTETQGGGILAEGSGIDLELENSTFRGNLASNGGALSIYAVAACNIDRNSKQGSSDRVRSPRSNGSIAAGFSTTRPPSVELFSLPLTKTSTPPDLTSIEWRVPRLKRTMWRWKEGPST